MIVKLEPFTITWAQQFEMYRLRIATALAHINNTIEHIGSTSVTGMTAKPVIDILVGVAEHDLNNTIEPMIDVGFTYVSKFENLMPYRRFFVLLQTPEATVISPADDRKFGLDLIPQANIHIIPADSLHFKRHIAFRDYLREHQDVREQYIALKQQIVKHEVIDHNDYSAQKSDYIKKVEAKALVWYIFIITLYLQY